MSIHCIQCYTHLLVCLIQLHLYIYIYHIGLGHLEMIKDITRPHPHVLVTIPEIPDEGQPSDVDPPPLTDYDSGYGSV